MYKYLNILVLVCMFGCTSIEVIAEVSTTYSVTLLDTEYSRGLQSDIKRDVLIVANDSKTWNEFINSTPSLIGSIPSFNADLETGIILITKAYPCKSIPYAIVRHQVWLDYTPNLENINVVLAENETVLKEGEICPYSDEDAYFYHLIKIKKTALPVSLGFSPIF